MGLQHDLSIRQSVSEAPLPTFRDRCEPDMALAMRVKAVP